MQKILHNTKEIEWPGGKRDTYLVVSCHPYGSLRLLVKLNVRRGYGGHVFCLSCSLFRSVHLGASRDTLGHSYCGVAAISEGKK